MTLFKNKSFILFAVLLLHITLLDLVMITYKGAVILVDKNIEFKTIITHLLIVCVSVGFYCLFNYLVTSFRNSKYKINDYVWIVLPIIFILLIGFILI